jgi:AraC-like DNA-binding protein
MSDLVPIPLALFDRLRRFGLDVDDVLERAELSPARFNVAKPEGTTAEFFALWRAVDEGGADPSLGLRLGGEALTDFQNVAVLAALHSATLGEGLEKLARYKRLVCPEKVWLDVADGEARLRFQWLLADGDPPPLLTDLIFAGVLTLAQQGTGMSIQACRIELSRRRAHEAMLRRHFGCEIVFDAIRDVMVFDEATLALPIVGRNAQLLAVLLPGLELALAQEDGPRTLVDDVRRAIVETMGGERPAISKVAKALGLSPRTMQRRLSDLGTRYQDLLDDVRRDTARRLLENTDLQIAEVAFLLGFEEVNSFLRAFRGWEGTTAVRWRGARRTTRRAISGTSREPAQDRARSSNQST